ncbi:MAG: hypothetical protein AB1Z67_00465 [Candidatus Limnocylindrales bacterium]
MRRSFAIVGAVALASAMAAPAVATPDDGEGHKDVVCHATSAEGKWVKIVVDTASAQSANKQKAHYQHTVEGAPGNKQHEQLDYFVLDIPEGEADAHVCGYVPGPNLL